MVNQSGIKVLSTEVRRLNAFEHHEGHGIAALLTSSIGIEEKHTVAALLLEAQETISEDLLALEANTMAQQDVVAVEAVTACPSGEVCHH